MDLLTLVIVAVTALYLLKLREQRQHTQLLAQYLGKYQIEKLMAGLMEGYPRAVAEADAARRMQIWSMLDDMELRLVEQFQRFARDFAVAPAPSTRVSTLPLALPYVDRVLPAASFDLRAAMQLHAKAIAAVQVQGAGDDEPERRRRAFTMTAELMLMQHTCHWFCRNRTIASMRLIARHKTPYEQVLKSVAPATGDAYRRLTHGK